MNRLNVMWCDVIRQVQRIAATRVIRFVPGHSLARHEPAFFSQIRSC